MEALKLQSSISIAMRMQSFTDTNCKNRKAVMKTECTFADSWIIARKVLDFFWRIEFQLRGLPHVHSMWWIKDALNLDTTAEADCSTVC